MAEQGVPNVVQAQILLRRAGYAPGVLDGTIGPTTSAAVLAFQRDAGLVDDGQLGPRTLDALARHAGTEPVQLSPSVSRYVYDPAPSGAVELAVDLYVRHDEYPDRQLVLDTLRRTRPGPVLPIAEWVQRVLEQLDPAAFAARFGDQPLLHGTLFVYGLARVDETLHGALAANDLLAQLRSSITPDPEQLFRPSTPNWPIASSNWEVVRVIDASGNEVLGQRLGPDHVLTTAAVLEPGTTAVTVVDPILELASAATVVEQIDVGDGQRLLVVRIDQLAQQAS